jgi:hypothetical protein
VTARDRRTSDKWNGHFADDFPAGSVKFGPEILATLKKSMHPPHLIENDRLRHYFEICT